MTTGRKQPLVRMRSNILEQSPLRSPEPQYKRLLSMQAITPLISRMNSSVKITKDLLNIIEREEQADGIIIPTINTPILKNTSYSDILPNTESSENHEFYFKNYTFQYRKDKEILEKHYIIQVELERIKNLVEKDCDIGSE